MTSASNWSSISLLKPNCKLSSWAKLFASNKRWIVKAFCPVVSLKRFAARPVGAAKRIFNPWAFKMDKMPLITVVLPVPGPPVSTKTPWWRQALMASFCFCASWIWLSFSHTLINKERLSSDKGSVACCNWSRRIATFFSA